MVVHGSNKRLKTADPNSHPFGAPTALFTFGDSANSTLPAASESSSSLISTHLYSSKRRNTNNRIKHPFGANQPAQFGASQVHPFGASQVHPFGASQVHPFGASQVHPFGANQTDQFGTSQAHPFGASQPAQFNASRTTQVGGIQAHPFGTNQQAQFGASNAAPPFGANQQAQFGTIRPSLFGAIQAHPFGASQAGPFFVSRRTANHPSKSTVPSASSYSPSFTSVRPPPKRFRRPAQVAAPPFGSHQCGNAMHQPTAAISPVPSTYDNNSRARSFIGKLDLICKQLNFELSKQLNFELCKETGHPEFFAFVGFGSFSLIKRLMDKQSSFQQQGFASGVDIGYHYTSAKSVEPISAMGFLNKEEREQRFSSAEQLKHHGSIFGKGIYTANNPYEYQKYGDTCILVARLLGRVKYRRSRDDQEVGTSKSYDTLIANKYWRDLQGFKWERDEIILQESSQCAPLLRFSRDAADIFRVSQTKPLPRIEALIIELLREFFN